MKKISLFILLSTLCSFQSFAKSSCDGEMERICGDAKEADCLKKNRLKLSLKCRKDLDTLDQRSKGLVAGCMGDIQKHCPINVDRFQKEGMAYMEEYKGCVSKMKSRFSKTCKEQMTNPKGSTKSPRVLR